LFENGTLEHLAGIIDQQDSKGKSSGLVPIQRGGDRIPFFCVHEFFGDVLCYTQLARHLGPDQPFYGIEPRGMDGRDEPFTGVESMAGYYIELIKTIQPHGPYAMGGLCFGGVIAFEMAQQLTASGEQVALLALMDSGIGSGLTGWRWWRRFLQNFSGDFGPWLLGALELTPSQWRHVLRLKYAMAKMRARRVFSRDDDDSDSHPRRSRLHELAELARYSERHLAIARAQSKALRSYQPQPYSGPLTLFRARMQPFLSCHEPDNGWSRVAAGELEVRSVPGNHLAMLQEPHVRTFAKELGACLVRANRGRSH
jgi:thioesterase domain-containing protein